MSSPGPVHHPHPGPGPGPRPGRFRHPGRWRGPGWGWPWWWGGGWGFAGYELVVEEPDGALLFNERGIVLARLPFGTVLEFLGIGPDATMRVDTGTLVGLVSASEVGWYAW